MGPSLSSFPLSLRKVLQLAERNDSYEEDAEDFLCSHNVPYCSHNRITLISLAWSHGWRPF